MSNGASRIFNIMNKVAESNKQTAQFVNVSVKSLDPLVFNLDDRVDLIEAFYQLDRTFSFTNLQLGAVFRAIVLNDGQLYFILSNGENELGNFWFEIDTNGHLILMWEGNTRPEFVSSDIRPDVSLADNGHLVMIYAGDIPPEVYIDENGHCIYNY